MLTAKKSALFERVFDVYNRNLLKRRFHSLKVLGSEFLRGREEKLPSIIYANHSSWWDGLVIFQIFRRCAVDGFVMMEEKQLKNLRLFRRLGAFSVVRENPRDAIKSINYATGLLREKPNRRLLIFPQGEIFPNDARPLEFFGGISKIIEKTGDCIAIPAAMRYEFSGEFKPEIFVKIGVPETVSIDENFDAKKLTKISERRLTATLDDLKNDILTGSIEDYKNII